VVKSRESKQGNEVFSPPPRLAIMLLLYFHRKVGFTELLKLLHFTPGNLDHHIRKLSQAGFVKTSKALSWRPLTVVEITRDEANAFRDYAMKLRKMLEAIS